VAKDKEQIARELLVARRRLGEPTAWEGLVRQWEPKLLYFVRRLVDNESDAFDVLQQTWLKVVRNIGALEDSGALAPWLYRVARNTALNYRRVGDAYRAAIAAEANHWHETADDQTLAFDSAEQIHYGLSRLSLPHSAFRMICGRSFSPCGLCASRPQRGQVSGSRPPRRRPY
jgi:RNA polymerase sigma-70 factor (ECF subfamily)